MIEQRPFYGEFAWAYDLLVNEAVEPWVDVVEGALADRGGGSPPAEASSCDELPRVRSWVTAKAPEGAMGFWDVLGREAGRVLRERLEPPTGSRSGSKSRRASPEALREPDPATLLTADEIEETTGGRPVGEGSRKYGNGESDVGYGRVYEWTLSNGGELLVNFTRFRDSDGLALWRSRIEDPSWRVEGEQPLEGVGELGWWYVTKDPKGGTEIHVTAKQGMYFSNLVHSSRAGATDHTPLAKLMVKVLSRLDQAPST